MAAANDTPADDDAQQTAPKSAGGGSYAFLDPAVKRRYLDFYKGTYGGDPPLDRKTLELVAIAASLAFNCNGCLDGHIKKARRFGATAKEISATIEVTLGVSAAAIVDRSDLSGQRTGLNFGSMDDDDNAAE